MDEIAHVAGVLRYNDKTRDEMLRRIYWKDEQYTSLGGDFVRYANIEDRESTSLTGGKGLQEFTYDKKTDYGKAITHKYLGQRETPYPYSTNDYLSNPELRKWEGDYIDNFVWETRLNDIGLAKRVNESAIAIIADENRFLVSKYITPELTRFYQDFPSVNLRTVKNSLDQYYTGRIPDIKEADVKFVHDYQDFLNERGGTAPGRQLSELLTNANRYENERGRVISGKYLEDERETDSFGQIIGDEAIFNNKDFSESTYSASKQSWAYNNVHFDDTTEELAVEQGTGMRYRNFYGTRKVFDEKDVPHAGETTVGAEGVDIGVSYLPIRGTNSKSLLSKTNQLFNDHKISTLAGRFHTSKENGLTNEVEETDTAKSPVFGNSHGRNLLKKNPNQATNGYSDPYCRVWTYHHQYDRFSKLIRPFSEEEGDIYSEEYLPYNTSNKGRENLKNRTVLDRLTNTVKIAPSLNGGIDIKDCMFSIENLAWKDVPNNKEYLSNEQRGPNGGRIMWFPPYNLNFSEQVQVGWQQHTFIGRGEPLFTYNNTTRRGTLSFALLIDHPSIIDNIPKNNIGPNDGDGDVEADALRFFAGCQIPDLTEVTGSTTGAPSDEPQKLPDNEPKLSIPDEEKSKRIKFYVYFPNNYSGNGGDFTPTWGSSRDNDWFDYILFGKDAMYGEKSNGRGYEMEDNGITISTETTEDSMPVYNVSDPEKYGIGTMVKGVYYKYRVDYDLHQYLVNKKKDGTSRGMTYNETNYADSQGFSLNTKKEENNDATHSFAQIVSAMYEAHPEYFRGTMVDKYHSELPDADAELVNLFKEKKCSDMKFEAGATEQDSKNSKKLAIRRGYALKDLVITRGQMEKTKKEGEIALPTPAIKLNYHGKLSDDTTVNTLEAKKQRYASLEIFYEAPEITKVSDAVHATSGNTIEYSEKGYFGEGHDLDNDLYGGEIEPAIATAYKTIDDGNGQVGSRYETESEYFQRLSADDPIAFKNIVDKFRYFSPAYHSISPEGFNARLTFLHQCTRQGHTVSASDGSFAMTAGNLSFGRMPVCVLKIGDFINTKIIIESVSINYDAQGDPQWDLNPEGAGVQPMYAKVQMGIAILGGQSLDGPINRLQNAVTFNYYANTGAYDNRSDRINMSSEADKHNDLIRVINEEDNANLVDKTEYLKTNVSYENIFTPYPDIEVQQNGRKIAGYNEYLARGGVHKNDDGNYELNEI